VAVRSPTPAPAPQAPRARKREVRAMLFADVKNFSKLPKRSAPGFLSSFSATGPARHRAAGGAAPVRRHPGGRAGPGDAGRPVLRRHRPAAAGGVFATGPGRNSGYRVSPGCVSGSTRVRCSRAATR
jgi:hypothetical protein